MFLYLATFCNYFGKTVIFIVIIRPNIGGIILPSDSWLCCCITIDGVTISNWKSSQTVIGSLAQWVEVGVSGCPGVQIPSTTSTFFLFTS